MIPRFPCFATGNPAAAATIPAAVEIFTIGRPPPPVPQQSPKLLPPHLPVTPAAFALAIQEEEAAGLSEAVAQLLTANRPWRQCRDHLLAAYPVAKRSRRDRFAEVMAGQRDFTAAELAAELPDLRRTLAQHGVAGEEDLGPERFLDLLRQKARSLTEPPRAVSPGGVSDLASAIRREQAG